MQEMPQRATQSWILFIPARHPTPCKIQNAPEELQPRPRCFLLRQGPSPAEPECRSLPRGAGVTHVEFRASTRPFVQQGSSCWRSEITCRYRRPRTWLRREAGEQRERKGAPPIRGISSERWFKSPFRAAMLTDSTLPDKVTYDGRISGVISERRGDCVRTHHAGIEERGPRSGRGGARPETLERAWDLVSLVKGHTRILKRTRKKTVLPKWVSALRRE